VNCSTHTRTALTAATPKVKKALFVYDYVFAVYMDGEGTSAGRSGVSEGKISWPTRGPNVDWTIGSTMRRRADWWIKKPCK
jgi:hypothetical protein